MILPYMGNSDPTSIFCLNLNWFRLNNSQMDSVVCLQDINLLIEFIAQRSYLSSQKIAILPFYFERNWFGKVSQVNDARPSVAQV